jgi:hypothetical protein
MVHMIDDRDFDVIFAFSPLSRGGILAKVTQVETKSGRLDHLLLVKQPHALLGEAEEGKRESGRGEGNEDGVQALGIAVEFFLCLVFEVRSVMLLLHRVEIRWSW